MKSVRTSLLLFSIALISACGGGGGGTASSQAPVVTPPVQVGDFNLGKFSATGDTVLKPNFSNSGQTQGSYKGTTQGIQAALANMDFVNLGLLNTPEASRLSSFGGSVDWGFLGLNNLTDAPVKLTYATEAGKKFEWDYSGIGSVISGLAVGQALGLATNYRWANFPDQNSGPKILNFSYAKSTQNTPAGIQPLVKHRIVVTVSLYWNDQFNQARSTSFPILSEVFENDFNKTISVSTSSTDYPIPQQVIAFELRTEINSLAIVGRSN
jgi:hypothetical protein